MFWLMTHEPFEILIEEKQSQAFETFLTLLNRPWKIYFFRSKGIKKFVSYTQWRSIWVCDFFLPRVSPFVSHIPAFYVENIYLFILRSFSAVSLILDPCSNLNHLHLFPHLFKMQNFLQVQTRSFYPRPMRVTHILHSIRQSQFHQFFFFHFIFFDLIYIPRNWAYRNQFSSRPSICISNPRSTPDYKLVSSEILSRSIQVPGLFIGRALCPISKGDSIVLPDLHCFHYFTHI